MSSNSLMSSPVKLPLNIGCSTSISTISIAGDSYLSVSILSVIF